MPTDFDEFVRQRREIRDLADERGRRLGEYLVPALNHWTARRTTRDPITERPFFTVFTEVEPRDTGGDPVTLRCGVEAFDGSVLTFENTLRAGVVEMSELVAGRVQRTLFVTFIQGSVDNPSSIECVCSDDKTMRVVDLLDEFEQVVFRCN
jgi:hypothetical protein